MTWKDTEFDLKPSDRPTDCHTYLEEEPDPGGDDDTENGVEWDVRDLDVARLDALAQEALDHPDVADQSPEELGKREENVHVDERRDKATGIGRPRQPRLPDVALGAVQPQEHEIKDRQAEDGDGHHEVHVEVVLRRAGEGRHLLVGQDADQDGQTRQPEEDLDPGREDQVVGGDPPAAAANHEAAVTSSGLHTGRGRGRRTTHVKTQLEKILAREASFAWLSSNIE